MPTLTVRSLAEFSTKPITDQMRILAEQKRPNAGPAAFKVHYYHFTRTAIFQYFKHRNDKQRLRSSIARVSTRDPHKKKHNQRAMRSFAATGAFNARILHPTRSQSIIHTRHAIDVRLYADLTALENGRTKYFLFNYTLTPLNADVARRALELMYWLLEGSSRTVSPSDVEIVDLASKAITTNKRKPRKGTISKAEQNLRVIKQLWPII